MGTFEIINSVLSLLGGGIMTLWGQKNEDRARSREFRKAMSDKQEESVRAAREHKARWGGFYWVRSAIALLVVSYLFVLPSAAVLSDGIQVVIGYYDTTGGFWPWDSPREAVTWIKIGAADAERVFVMDPIRNNIAITITNMYFGNQFARRSRS